MSLHVRSKGGSKAADLSGMAGMSLVFASPNAIEQDPAEGVPRCAPPKDWSIVVLERKSVTENARLPGSFFSSSPRVKGLLMLTHGALPPNSPPPSVYCTCLQFTPPRIILCNCWRSQR